MVAFSFASQVSCIRCWGCVAKLRVYFYLAFVLQKRKRPCWMSPVWSMFACGHCADRCCVKLFMEGQSSAVRVFLFVCKYFKYLNITGVKLWNWIFYIYIYVLHSTSINFIHVVPVTIRNAQESDSSFCIHEVADFFHPELS